MSELYDSKIDDIQIDEDAQEVMVFVTQGYHGSIYSVISFETLDQLWEKLGKGRELDGLYAEITNLQWNIKRLQEKLHEQD